MSKPALVHELHATFGQRQTPEAVAAIIQRALPDPGRRLAVALRTVVEGSIARRFGWSSMAVVFRAPENMNRQIAKARELALLFVDGTLPAADDADALDAFLIEFNALIGKSVGASSFKKDRRNRVARAAAGLDLSRRRYTKLFRLAGRLERRLGSLRREEAKYRLTLVGKAALAPDLALEDIGDHVPTAAFVAYYAARMKLRSEFTNQSQQRPFDEVAAALLERCAADPGTRWYAIAHVFLREDVLAHLNETEKGALLGRWFDILQEIADRLEAAYRATDINLETMIVKRGNDSSTWNLMAGAWNRARDHWIALVAALGLTDLFETMLPGKVMRLMAADVAQWHRMSGGRLHPDTEVWSALPKPWDVLRGETACTRAMIEATCKKFGVDAVKGGWTAPRARRAVSHAKPTPELVHGVAVDNPYFAALLRDAGAFSGKPLRKKFLAKLFGN